MLDTYNQITESELNAVKGAFGTGLALEKTLEGYNYVDGKIFRPGRVVSVHPTDGQWRLGCPLDGGHHRVPFFVWDGNRSGQFDVRKVPGGVGGGKFVALCALGGYEVFSTEFIAAGSWPFNRALSVYNVDDADLGKVQLWDGNPGQVICGYTMPTELHQTNGVITLPGKTAYNKDFIQFLTCFRPV